MHHAVQRFGILSKYVTEQIFKTNFISQNMLVIEV